jgi:dipeptidyl aminopeptidase/acylaminoacyl peptidase
MLRKMWLAAAALGAVMTGAEYKRAPERIRAILDAPATPTISINPTRTHALLLEARRYPPVSELAQPMLRLAGLRINPRNNAPHRMTTYRQVRLVRLDTGAEVSVQMPVEGRFGAPRWSGDGKWFAILQVFDDRVEAWVGRVETGEFRRLAHNVNAAWGEAVEWMPDNRHLLVKLIPAERGAPPAAPAAPEGPTIQETAGKAGPSRTNPDALRNAHDERLFDYYMQSQLTLIDLGTGRRRNLGTPSIYEDIAVAPNGEYLLVTRVQRPYSYVLTASEFAKSIEVWRSSGERVRTITERPLAERVPIEGVVTGPRGFQWEPNGGATLVWAEALDEGNPRKEVPQRDRLMRLAAPFTGEPEEWLRTEQRYVSARWLEDDPRVLITDYDRKRRWIRTQLVGAGQPARVLWSRNIADAYGDWGTPLGRTLPTGHRVVEFREGAILLAGDGASPEGDRPFLDRYVVATGQKERLFHSARDAYETVVARLEGNRLLTRRETPTTPPNYVIRREGEIERWLTELKDPAPELRRVRKQLVTYQRADGVPLSFTLYLPPDAEPGKPLPTVVWAYPREFTDAGTAGQVRGSQQRFTMPTGASHLFFLLAGYAILDGAAMPVVGDPETANNTYIEQVVASAKAAIDKAAAEGWTDPKRVGVGGHSYGAFMTANLLAHSDLFQAGIARSGAYNRTLTPFGFQAEPRTLWEAPEVYLRMSPFLVAHKINEPILFIHGEADDNQGTFPIQSERMYAAVRGNGGIARYVVLPYEAHGYTARESVEHVIAEMIEWFDRHVAKR